MVFETTQYLLQLASEGGRIGLSQTPLQKGGLTRLELKIGIAKATRPEELIRRLGFAETENRDTWTHREKPGITIGIANSRTKYPSISVWRDVPTRSAQTEREVILDAFRYAGYKIPFQEKANPKRRGNGQHWNMHVR